MTQSTKQLRFTIWSILAYFIYGRRTQFVTETRVLPDFTVLKQDFEIHLQAKHQESWTKTMSSITGIVMCVLHCLHEMNIFSQFGQLRDFFR